MVVHPPELEGRPQAMLDETAEVENLGSFGPLTFVYYQEEGFDGLIGAHCLELDIGGQGATREEATRDLQSAVKTYVLYHLDNNLEMEDRLAPPELANLLDRSIQNLVILRVVNKRETSPKRQALFVRPPERFTPALTPA
jgi:hypothetical protein